MESEVPWFEEYQDTYELEIKRLQDFGIAFAEDTIARSNGILILDLEIPIQNKLKIILEKPLKLQIKYPDSYPFFKPEVFAYELQLPRHQNPIAKNLCLLARSTEKWTVGQSVADYLKDQLPKLLEKGIITNQEIIGEDVDEQAEPISDYFKGPGNVIVMSAFPVINNNLNLKEGSFKFDLENHQKDFSFGPDGPVLKVVISAWKDSTGKTIEQAIDKPGKFEAPWVQVDTIPLDNAERELMFNAKLGQFRHKSLSSPIKIKNGRITMILGITFPEERVKGRMGQGWLFLISFSQKRGNFQSEEHRILPIAGTRISKEDYQLRIPKLHSLGSKTISIAGLGSLGAPSAIEFARNGVKRLKLLDFDTVEPSSTVRWPLGIRYAGMNKGHALKEFINENYPHVEIEVLSHRMGAPRGMNFSNKSEKAILNEFLSESSLIFDSTGELGINNLLFYEARYRNIPFISIEGTAGVWGGLVMRSIPGRDSGCWLCFRHHFMDGFIAVPPSDLQGNVQPGGCGDITFVGTSFELQNIALAGVRLVISTLCNDANGYPDVDWDVAVLSLVDPKSNKIILPSWKEYKITKHNDCSYCGRK